MATEAELQAMIDRQYERTIAGQMEKAMTEFWDRKERERTDTEQAAKLTAAEARVAELEAQLAAAGTAESPPQSADNTSATTSPPGSEPDTASSGAEAAATAASDGAASTAGADPDSEPDPDTAAAEQAAVDDAVEATTGANGVAGVPDMDLAAYEQLLAEGRPGYVKPASDGGEQEPQAKPHVPPAEAAIGTTPTDYLERGGGLSYL